MHDWISVNLRPAWTRWRQTQQPDAQKLTERNMLGRLAKSLKLNETGKQKMFDYFEQGEL